MEGNTAWVLASSALVLFMTPGLAFFYGGMVRSKNCLGMLMQNFFSMGLVSVLWALAVFSLAFGGEGKYIGDLGFAGLKTLGNIKTVIPAYSGKFALVVPPLAFVAFQLMFAIITPALITGAIADRMKFRAWVVFLGAWLVLVYAPVAHWVFAPVGWLFQLGALDFAGGTVVHINAGIAALALVLVIGRRKGWPDEAMPPHSLPFTLLGTGMLWFGWFGFNAGSALAANGLAAQAFLNTNNAAAAAMLGWLVVERLKGGHATTLGAASGAVAGLVAITPCAGYVGGISPLVIGFIAGAVCFLAIQLKYKFGYDERPRRRRRAPGRRDRRVAPPRPVRRAGGQPRLRCRWPIVRRRIWIARQAGGRGRGHHRLVGRHLLRPGQGHLGDHRTPGHP
jgi:Amt family ammonium transporter